MVEPRHSTPWRKPGQGPHVRTHTLPMVAEEAGPPSPEYPSTPVPTTARTTPVPAVGEGVAVGVIDAA